MKPGKTDKESKETKTVAAVKAAGKDTTAKNGSAVKTDKSDKIGKAEKTEKLLESDKTLKNAKKTKAETVQRPAVKKIGVLTSGGDAPGMNAAIRAVVRTAIADGMEVVGIRRGFSGLIDEDFVKLDSRSVADTIQKGGTFLFTARCPEMITKEGQDEGRE